MTAKELKQECIKILDARGWDDKGRVDLRSRASMESYLRYYEVLKQKSIGGNYANN